ncbi:MAG: electron transfer flavoprotein subunit beta/FixA family protein [Candidatus Wallbacteria bacterium]
MNILVLMKQTPDTESKIKLNSDNTAVDKADFKYIVNPYDEYAIEEAIKLSEAFPNSKVTLVTVGDGTVKETIRKGLAVGATDGVLIGDNASGSCPFAAAKTLSEYIAKMQFDIILSGIKAVDDDFGIVPTLVAGAINIPVVTGILKLTVSPDNKTAQVEREGESGREVIVTNLPALFTAQKGLNEPRYASLKGIMAAKKKEIKEEPALNSPAKIKTVKIAVPPARPAGKKIDGDFPANVKTLVGLLRCEAKVI